MVKKIENKRKIGRPSKYSNSLAKEICRAIATSTQSLKKICQSNGFPCTDTIYAWCFDYPEFSVMYDQAKRLQAARLAEEVIEIADDDSNDLLQNEKGFSPNGAKVQRDRLKVDARKWIACKLLPKVYGEKPKEEESNFTDAERAELRGIMSELMVKHERDY